MKFFSFNFYPKIPNINFYDKSFYKGSQIKRNLLLIFLSTILFSCSGGDGNEDSTNFSDEIIGDSFKVSAEFAVLFNKIEGFSIVGNNQILKEEAESINELDLSDPTGGSTIGHLDDLSGIENFINLKKLTVDRQSLRRVDLSKNTKLEFISIANNKLIEINLKNLEFLEELQLIGNQLETIDLSDNPYLKILRLGENYFSSFDLELTPRLNYLVLKSNPLTELKNLEDLNLLKDLFLESTNLSSLDVSNLISLSFLDANDTSLLNCIKVSRSQLDNLVESWLFDEGDKFSLDCNLVEESGINFQYNFNEIDLNEPPFGGTIFVSGNIITSSDTTLFGSLKYNGTGARQMYDRREGGAWINIEPHLFDTNFSDGLKTEIQINPEFTAEEATFEANKYAILIGQLPTALRKDVQTMWIHKGEEAYGGGNNNLLVHTGMSKVYENWSTGNIIEETLIHEATHTSIDAYHYPDRETDGAAWIDAVSKDDGCYISSYARDYPYREDLAELMPLYIAVRYFPERISTDIRDKILSCNLNRIRYLDSLKLDMSIYQN